MLIHTYLNTSFFKLDWHVPATPRLADEGGRACESRRQFDVRKNASKQKNKDKKCWCILFYFICHFISFFIIIFIFI